MWKASHIGFEKNKKVLDWSHYITYFRSLVITKELTTEYCQTATILKLVNFAMIPAQYIHINIPSFLALIHEYPLWNFLLLYTVLGKDGQMILFLRKDGLCASITRVKTFKVTLS